MLKIAVVGRDVLLNYF